jgi:hypothetical protein
MGVQKVNGVPNQQHGSPDQVSSSQFATATQEQWLWWERGDIESQLGRVGIFGDTTGQHKDKKLVMMPVVWLDYYSTVDDVTLSKLAKREGLVMLSVRGTRITDAGLRHLDGLKELSQLNLTDTSITDDGLRHLEAIVSLRKLNLEGTRVTQAGVARLRLSLPKLEIEVGGLER